MIYIELDVTCIRNKILAARRDCSRTITNFAIDKYIFQLKTTYICFFSHTLAVTIVSPPTTMLQVVTAFFPSLAYSDLLIWQ